MVFHDGKNHLVPLLEKCTPIGCGHKIYSLSGTTCENHLVSRRSIDKFLHASPRTLLKLGSLHRKRMDSAMDISLSGGVAANHRINHTVRGLRCGCVIQINQLMSVNLTLQNGILLTYFSYVHIKS